MTAPQSRFYDSECKAAVKRALCLTDGEKLGELKETLDILGWRYEQVDSVQQAVNAIQFGQYHVLIASLSTSKASLFDETIFDQSSRRVAYTSSFLDHVMDRSPSTFRIVFGFEAFEFEDIRQACFDCGADAVVNTTEALFEILFGLGAPPSTCQAENERCLLQFSGGIRTTRMQSEQCSSSRRMQFQQSHSTMLSSITPSELAPPAIIPVSRLDMSINLNDLNMPINLNDLNMPIELTLPRQSDSVPSLLNDESCRINDYSLLQSEIFVANGTGTRLRLVHVSDTLGMHRDLILPEGDIFMHAGNFTNGKASTWLQQFEDFLDWISQEVLASFRQVVFIAGSQDMFLDTIACKYNAASREAQRILNRFLSLNRSVAFLENTSITFQGLKIHGSSTTLLKNSVNADVKHGAFERDFDAFVRPEIDDECDILLTHRPPSFMFQQTSYELLTDRLYEAQVEEDQGRGSRRKLGFRFRKSNVSTGVKTVPKLVPRVHAFGHYEKDFGVGEMPGTLLLNGSQAHVLGDEKYRGGIPLLVDVPLNR